MNHWFKQQSIQELVRYNKYLLISTAIISVLALLLGIALINKEERWLLIPAIEPERRMIVSSNIFHESYLKEWAIFVMKGLFITSPEEVERQVADMKVISSSGAELEKFFAEHLQFVKGSNVTTVFFPKSSTVTAEGVLIKGTFRYWFGGSDRQIAAEKSYLLSYKRGANKLLLLTNIREKEE